MALSDIEHSVRFRARKCLRPLADVTHSLFFCNRKGRDMTATDYTYEDPELGRFHIRVSPRARRLTFRAKNRELWVTIPAGASVGEVKRAIDSLRPRLRHLMSTQARPPIDWKFRIDAPCFRLSLTRGTTSRFLIRREGEETQIVCPPDTNFADTQLQDWLHRVAAEAMRHRAKEVLPLRLEMLARAHGLTYNSVKINASAGRWGSCSARGDINLSLHLMLLPLHLIDYVLLHELSHTREMNHGPRFWALLNRMTAGKAQALREELKGYRCNF